MKKIFNIIICLLVCFSFNIIDVFADVETFERTPENNYLVNGTDIIISDNMIPHILSTPAVDASVKVYDFANLYTENQEELLYSKITNYIDNYDLDLAVVTINRNEKISTEAYAQDFYDYNDFGIGSSYDGVLFLIDMDKREFYMVTNGAGITMYTDVRIDKCLDVAYNYIVAGEYYNGTDAFINELDRLASIGEPDKYGREPRLTGIAKLKSMSWSSIVIFSFIATVVVMYILISNNKLARVANSSRHYMTKADVSVANEIFLGKNVHRTPRASESSSGGSSSSGRSISTGSSGRSHGGGGRKF